MKGSRVQSIIKELRGEKIDIIEWSDEPSVFAANALSPAKVTQVRITDINDRQMEVIVGEDQLSLAIGKKGQNVRLATRLVGWDIKIVSEEILKKEIARQMGRMMASGEAVPITSLEGVNANQADALEAKGITDVEKLAATSVDDLVDALDVSLDEAERILASASAIVAAKEEQQGGQASGSGEDNSSEISEEAGSPTTDDSAVGEPEPATEADTSLDENAEVNGDENTAAGETVSDAEEEQIAQDADVNEEQS
jgi:N utilization substance protein A